MNLTARRTRGTASGNHLRCSVSSFCIHFSSPWIEVWKRNMETAKGMDFIPCLFVSGENLLTQILMIMPFAIRKPHHSAYRYAVRSTTPSDNPSVRFVNSVPFSCTLGGGGLTNGAQFVNFIARCTVMLYAVLQLRV